MRRLENLQYLLGLTLLNMIIFGIVPNLLSDLVVKQNLLWSGVIIAAVAVSYVLLRCVVNHFAKRSRRELTLVQRENPAPRKGLVVFMSPGDRVTPAENAVKAHLAALEHCWVISGPARPGQKPTSYDNAKSLTERYQNAKEAPIQFHLKDLEDEDNPQQSYYLVRSIYEEARAFGLSERDVIADYTGGTKSMTAGMVLACSTSEERDTEYMKALQVTPAGIATPTTQAVPVMVDLNFGSPA